MLRAILSQLLYHDDSAVAYLYERCSSSSLTEPEMKTEGFLEEAAKGSLTVLPQTRTYLILDGLDECAIGQTTGIREVEKILSWAREIVSQDAADGNLNVLLSGQRDGLLDSSLADCPMITLDGVDAHGSDIGDFITSCAAKIRKKFELTTEEELNVVDRVTESSGG